MLPLTAARAGAGENSGLPGLPFIYAGCLSLLEVPRSLSRCTEERRQPGPASAHVPLCFLCMTFKDPDGTL